jgi:hypothetical protein
VYGGLRRHGQGNIIVIGISGALAQPEAIPMRRDFFDPQLEQIRLVVVASKTLRQVERMIESCEQCNPDAEIPFD